MDDGVDSLLLGVASKEEMKPMLLLLLHAVDGMLNVTNNAQLPVCVH